MVYKKIYVKNNKKIPRVRPDKKKYRFGVP
jgi:hypothetical protein